MEVFRRHTLRVIFSHLYKVFFYCLQIKIAKYETRNVITINIQTIIYIFWVRDFWFFATVAFGLKFNGKLTQKCIRH